jgi:hypothetical protein
VGASGARPARSGGADDSHTAVGWRLGRTGAERAETWAGKLGGSGIARSGALVQLACHLAVLGRATSARHRALILTGLGSAAAFRGAGRAGVGTGTFMGKPAAFATGDRSPHVGIARTVGRASGPSRRGRACRRMGRAGSAASRVGWSRRARVAACRPACADRRSVGRPVMGATRGRGPAAGGARGARVEPSRRAVLGRVFCSRRIAAGSSCPVGRLGPARRVGAVRSACDRGSIVGCAGRAFVGCPEDRGTGRSTRSVMGSPRRATPGMGNPRRARSRGREAIGGERAGRTLERSGRGRMVRGGPRRAGGTTEHRHRVGRRGGWRIVA